MTQSGSHATDIGYPYTSAIQGRLFSSTSRFSPQGVVVQVISPESQEVLVQVFEVTRLSPCRCRCVVSINQAPPISAEFFVDGQTTWLHTSDISLGLTTSLAQRRSVSGAASGSDVVTSPIPGKVAALHVKEGDSVAEGALILVLDSMKMEHPFRATRNGTIVSLGVTNGAIIQAGTTLFVLG
jgi:biotin carboxyl carrier protein